MNILITNFIGFLLTIMIILNAELTNSIGMYYALICIHTVGLIGTLIMLTFTKQKITFDKNLKIIFYFGGAFGVLTVLSNSFSFLAIGASMTATLGLLGQTISSIIVDVYGLGDSEKKPFNKNKLLGLSIIVIGIIVMEVF